MQKQKVKCIACEEELEIDPDTDIGINSEGEEVYLTWTDKYSLSGEGNLICETCKEVDQEHLTTVVKYDRQGRSWTAKIGEYSAWIEQDGYIDNEGEELEEAYSIVKHRKWHRIDAWRGYYALDNLDHSFKVVTNGWVTGYPDDTVKYKDFTYELYEYLKEKGAPFPIWWVFSVTSNLFSTAVDIVILKKDAKRWRDWISNTFNKTEEEVELAFS